MSSVHLPSPLMTSEPGSFAQATIIERKPQIIQQVLDDQHYPESIARALETFRKEIAHQVIRQLSEDAPDTPFWNAQVAVYKGRTWLDLPWYFAETYFYRRLLEATGYFQAGPYKGKDPFLRQKQRSMVPDAAWFAATWDQFTAAGRQNVSIGATFEALLHSCLWGNRADLSNYTVKEQVQGGLAARSEKHLVLIDDTEKVQARLASGVRRVEFINDNVGKELFFDLALADFLLQEGWAKQVTFNLKDRPFFVSDAMPADARASIDLLQGAQTAGSHALGERLNSHLHTGGLKLAEDPFWTSSLMFRQMPQGLRRELDKADLVILKGDVNYRRILDDRHWPFTTRMEMVAAYFPAPFVSLRTLKGEIMVGLRPEQVEALDASDPTWLINGKRGVIQFIDPGV